jgi:hypothetical protein
MFGPRFNFGLGGAQHAAPLQSTKATKFPNFLYRGEK